MKLNDRIASPLGIPIIVTENGFSPPPGISNPAQKRNQFYSEYLSMVLAAINDGCPVRGYLTWSFADNYEWQSPKNKSSEKSRHRYGLFSVASNGTLTLKDPHNFIIACAKWLHIHNGGNNTVTQTQEQVTQDQKQEEEHTDSDDTSAPENPSKKSSKIGNVLYATLVCLYIGVRLHLIFRKR